jgi:integrase/recombinase XerD
MLYRDVIKLGCSRSHARRTVMATDVTAIGSAGHRYPMIAAHADATRWIRSCAMLGLAGNTIAAYSRAMEIFLGFCQSRSMEARCATRELIAQYIHYLRTRPRQGRGNIVLIDSQAAVSNATLQQQLTAVRLFFEFLVEEQLIQRNPVGRGRYTASKHFGRRTERGLLPRFRRLPWIPTEEQWAALLQATVREPIRNRCMMAFAYDGALRREELCQLRSDDLDPAHRLLRVRAETTKGRRERVLPYSAVSGELLQGYLRHRRTLGTKCKSLFVSESPRNFAMPITLWTWSKVTRAIGLRAGVPRFSTHTLRHLCLTDLARAGWDLHELARFAGHQNLETTLQYIHLSGRDLADRLSRTIVQLHAWRLEALSDSREPTGCP